MINKETPGKIIYWKDAYDKKAVGWIVIHNKINGIAGGGLFLSPSATLEEVKDLAYTMSLKNRLQEPLMGGGKGGIRFDHTHPEAPNVLFRFLKDNKDVIENDWCTGGDLNTTTSMITKALKKATGLPSPFICLLSMLKNQFGIHPDIDRFHQCLLYPFHSHFKLEDIITGYSVFETVLAIMGQKNKDLGPRKVIVQGFGKVGKAACFFLKNHFDVVGICEKNWFIYDHKGINIDSLLRSYQGERLLGHKVINRNANEGSEAFLIRFLKRAKGNIFCPCAQRYAITEAVFTCLMNHTFSHANPNERSIISGANNAFAHPICDQLHFNQQVLTAPEWISNCGSAILFMEAMKFDRKVDASWVDFIFSKVRSQIREALRAIS